MNNEHGTSKQRRQSITRLKVGGLFAAGVIVLAACGGGGGKSAAGNGMAGMAMGGGNAAGPSTAVATDAVNIKNFGFSPATITVTAGSTVVWTNSDSVQHDITFNGGGIASSVLNHNDTFSHTFPATGTYHYICSIHPFMHGTVIVTASGSHHANATNSNTSAQSGY
jgi:plastocyanin